MLRGDRLILREWRESDLGTIAELRNNIELQALLMTHAKPNSIEQVRRWLVERTSRDDMIFFIVADRSDDATLGFVQTANLDWLHGVGELGICFSPSAQGLNLAQEACKLLNHYLRHTMGIRKLTLKVLASNTRAIKFYQKDGYREVGRLEKQFLVDNEYQDVVIMERFLST